MKTTDLQTYFFVRFHTILTHFDHLPSLDSLEWTMFDNLQTYSHSVHMTKRVLSTYHLPASSCLRSFWMRMEGQDNADILYQQIVNGAGFMIGHMAQPNIIAPLPQIYIWVKYYCLFAKTKTNKYVFQAASPPCVPICNDVNN